MLIRVISGGQAGVDQAAWRAARACGLGTGGRMPRGWRTEEGRRRAPRGSDPRIVEMAIADAMAGLRPRW